MTNTTTPAPSPDVFQEDGNDKAEETGDSNESITGAELMKQSKRTRRNKEEGSGKASTTDDTRVSSPNPKPPDDRRIAPSGVPVPTEGMAKFAYWMWKQGMYGKDYQVPALSKNQHAEYRVKMERINELVTELIELADEIRRIIAVMNSKGGSGKSPLAANLATVLMWAIDMQVLLIDVNENDGSAHRTLGIKRKDTRSVRYVMNNLENFKYYNQLCRELGKPRQQHKGVWLVCSDPGVTGNFNKDLFLEMLLQLWLSVHSEVLDGGNGNEVAANERSVEACTNLVISAMADDSDTFEKAISTLAAHYNMGHLDKVKNSFIAVNATHPGDTRNQYLEKLRLAAEELTVEDVSKGETHKKERFTLEDLGITVDSIYLIPFDQYIKNRGVADVPSLQLETLIAYLELLVAIFKQNAAVRKLDISEPVDPPDTSVNMDESATSPTTQPSTA